MHTLLIATSLALALGGCLVSIGLLRLARSSSSRRALQVAGMFVPVFVVGTLAVLMVHFLSQTCFLTSTTTDMNVSKGLLAVGGVGMILAIALNLLRATLLPVYLRCRTWDAPGWLKAKVAGLATETGLRYPPRARVVVDPQPWALVAGILQPHLVVSTGIVSLLDEEELAAVLCHELLHIRRNDLWWTAFGGILHDLTWFLPAARRLYKKLLAEQEIACDDRIVGESARLALASALTRVWRAELKGSVASRGALALVSHGQPASYESRVRRLMERPGLCREPARFRGIVAAVVLLGLFIPGQLWSALLVMDEMGCGLHQLNKLMSTMLH